MDFGYEGATEVIQPWNQNEPELWHGGPNGRIAELPNEDLVATGQGFKAGWLFASESSRAAGWGGFAFGSVAAVGKRERIIHGLRDGQRGIASPVATFLGPAGAGRRGGREARRPGGAEAGSREGGRLGLRLLGAFSGCPACCCVPLFWGGGEKAARWGRSQTPVTTASASASAGNTTSQRAVAAPVLPRQTHSSGWSTTTNGNKSRHTACRAVQGIPGLTRQNRSPKRLSRTTWRG